MFALVLHSIFYQATLAQGNYSKWNGKIWEQLDGNGKMVQLNPFIMPFNILEVDNINMKIIVDSTNDPYTMSIAIDDNLKNFFRFKQVGDSLKLYMDYGGGKYPRWLSTSNILVRINAPFLTTLLNKGNSKVEVKLQDLPTFKIAADGNPNIILSGKLSFLELQLSGNANIMAGKLLSEKIQLSAQGNSDIEVNAKELIEASMKGNNDINNLYYKPIKETLTDETAVERKTLSYSRFSIVNNSLQFAKISLISYRPDENGNGTVIFTLIPQGRKSFRFPIGTKIYLANNEQVNTVMAGKKITDQPPFLLLKAEDNGKTFDIK